MKNIKIIVTDLDKTLLRKDKTISEYTKSIFKKCHQAGLFIVFATARPERATRQWQINGSSCYVIANNGATITHGGKEIQNMLIPETTKHSIISRFMTDRNITGICVETGDFLYSNDSDYSTWGAVYTKDIGWNPVFNDYLAPISEDICKISVECANPQIVLDILRSYPDLRSFPNNGENWHQITHKSASKFNAVTYLSKMVGIAMQDIIAFGDDYNDVEMIQKCGVGVAVKNAVADVKEAADFICDSNDDDGVAKFIENNMLL